MSFSQRSALGGRTAIMMTAWQMRGHRGQSQIVLSISHLWNQSPERHEGAPGSKEKDRLTHRIFRFYEHASHSGCDPVKWDRNFATTASTKLLVCLDVLAGEVGRFKPTHPFFCATTAHWERMKKCQYDVHMVGVIIRNVMNTQHCSYIGTEKWLSGSCETQYSVGIIPDFWDSIHLDTKIVKWKWSIISHIWLPHSSMTHREFSLGTEFLKIKAGYLLDRVALCVDHIHHLDPQWIVLSYAFIFFWKYLFLPKGKRWTDLKVKIDV